MIHTNKANTTVTIILGKKGSGKTTFILNMLKNKKKSRAIIFDQEHDFQVLIPHTGLIIAENFDEFTSLIDNTKLIACQFTQFEDYYKVTSFLNNCKNFNLIIDEMASFVDARHYDENLDNIVRTSRHKNASLVLMSQSPINMSSLHFTQSDFVICHNLDLADVKNLAGKISLPTDYKLFATRLKGLKRFEYVVIDRRLH